MKLSKEFKVGLFMVVSLSLLYVGFQFLKGIDFFSTTHKFYVVYKDVDKLTESNLVYLNGTAVGRVSDIQIQQKKNRVVVQLDIDSEIVLTDSTSAVLDGELLGGRYIILDVKPGTRKLNPKDTIRAVVPKGIFDFAATLSTTAETTLTNLNVVLANLARNTNRLDTMFIRLQSTPGLLNRTLLTANTTIGGIGDSLRSVTGNVNATLTQLKPTLANFHTLSDSLKMLQINGTLKRANVSLTKLNETLSRLNKGDNTASKLLTEDTLYVNLNKLLLDIDALAKHFDKNPKHFLGPLGKSQKKIERDLKKQDSKK
ncbi:phospholipid/cholesterol/gamma-HCH transport system substrate-binding protein [Chryseolinea serpens]|uniref:Phospholipid/cholesterol/gamma-HCH transport system substrate-binding protein n=1 Tax=Chryseolinea serpens TaxID=947013 RepID=A0A1M5WLH7_9BACT|nr:MlaD family protein [Chryseolinea serpens]SHH88014.1 phospholipid/cholesterol/gamma-HCH transport system substrate-binding protein [Chryseolinea serpens]